MIKITSKPILRNKTRVIILINSRMIMMSNNKKLRNSNKLSSMFKVLIFSTRWLRKSNRSRKRRNRSKIKRLSNHLLPVRCLKIIKTSKTPTRLDNLIKKRMRIWSAHLQLTLMKVMKLWSMRLMIKLSKCKVDSVLIKSKSNSSTKLRMMMKLCMMNKMMLTLSNRKMVKKKTLKRISKRPMLLRKIISQHLCKMQMKSKETKIKTRKKRMKKRKMLILKTKKNLLICIINIWNKRLSK
mmetsp:Transcript_118751/g.165463  ORF Transcript_118751/g.165463 Transcript_118751/m.165463 type:complete len:240 (-) Transcript_118751:83-802(-)